MKKTLISSAALIFAGIISISCISSESKSSASAQEETQASNNLSGEKTENPTYKPVPELFKKAIKNAGALKSVSYKSKDIDGQPTNKTAIVYLPWQYNNQIKYDILYLMHGAGGNCTTLMGDSENFTELKHVIDNMIDHKLIHPLIIVMPTITMNGFSRIDELPVKFQEELRNDLIPAIENQYSTHAASTSEVDLIKSRDHRAFGGFSMGSTTTWFALLENLSFFKNFIPISGDCWAIERMGGVNKPKETAQLIANSIRKQGFTPKDFFIFSATGTKDIAYQGLTNQIEEMKKLSDEFTFSYMPDKGNLYYLVAQDGLHDYNWVTDYLYDVLPYLFSGQN